jgi:hypothetical protein
VHLFGAGLVAGLRGAVHVFRLDDVDIFRENRRESLVQVVYTLRRRSDGRTLKLENVLHVEKLVEAIQDGPVWEPTGSEADEAAADRAARAADEASERRSAATFRVLALVPLPVAAISLLAGGYFLLAVGDPPRCDGEPMRPTDRCVSIEENLSYEQTRIRQDRTNRTYAFGSFGLTALCGGPAAVAFWPRRLSSRRARRATGSHGGPFEREASYESIRRTVEPTGLVPSP